MSGKRLGLTAGVSLLAAAVGAGVFAELTPGQKMAAEVLIGQFSDKQFAVRQQAVEKLIALGPDVLPLIRKTLADTDDNEVKLRCRMVLKGIAEKYGIVVDQQEPGMPGGPGLGGSRVTIDVTNVPLSEVLQSFADQSGNRLLSVDDKLKGRSITLAVDGLPYWEALDKLCWATELLYVADWPGGGMRLQSSQVKAPDFGACAGPVVVKLERVTWSHRLRVPRKAEIPARGTAGELTYVLGFWWEDSIPVISSHGKVTRAVTPDGATLEQLEAPVPPRREPPGGVIVVCLRPPPVGLRALGAIEGVVQLELGTGERAVRLEDALTGEGKTIAVGGVPFEIVARRGETSVDLTLKPTRDDAAEVISGGAAPQRYGFFLEDPNGQRYAGHMAARSDPKAEVRLQFSDLGAVGGPWSLVYVFPQRRVRKDYPFTIKDVPVP